MASAVVKHWLAHQFGGAQARAIDIPERIANSGSNI